MVAAELMEAEISARDRRRQGRDQPRPGAPTATATARGPGRPGSARSSWRSRASAAARATSRASWSRANAPRRRSSGWSWRPTSTGSRPGRSTISSQSSGSTCSKDQVSRICGELDGQVEAFRTRPLEGELPLPLAGCQAPEGEGPGPRPFQGADGRLRGPRERQARGDRHRDRRVGDRGRLGRLPARAAGPWPPGSEALRLRRPPRIEGRGGQGAGLPVAALHRVDSTGPRNT